MILAKIKPVNNIPIPLKICKVIFIDNLIEYNLLSY